VLKDEERALGRLDEDLIGVIAFQGPRDRLASKDQADSDLLALSLGMNCGPVCLGAGLVAFSSSVIRSLRELPPAF
jgi:hypothetical protein